MSLGMYMHLKRDKWNVMVMTSSLFLSEETHLSTEH